MAIWAADVCSRAARQLICIQPTGLRLRHIGKTDPQSNSAFIRADSLVQLLLASGPSPRPCRQTRLSQYSATLRGGVIIIL